MISVPGPRNTYYVVESADTNGAFAECFLESAHPLFPEPAVAGLLVLGDGRYVMQLRDSKPEIFYPGHWGCFGGAISDGEAPLEALRRELDEELEFRLRDAVEFTRFDFDFSNVGKSKTTRIFYEVRVSDAEFGMFVLHEGSAFEAIDGRDLLLHRRVTPYDAFAIWMHMNKKRFDTGKIT